MLTCPTMKLVILSLCLSLACVSTKRGLSKKMPPIPRPSQPMRTTKSGDQPEQKICQSTNWKLQAKVLLQRLKNQPQIAVHWNSRRVQRALLTSVVLRTPARTALLVDMRLLRMNGLGRYVFVHVLSSTTACQGCSLYWRCLVLWRLHHLWWIHHDSCPLCWWGKLLQYLG